MSKTLKSKLAQRLMELSGRGKQNDPKPVVSQNMNFALMQQAALNKNNAH